MPRVGIAGGSIGGLTAALVLRDLGCEVDVFERSGTALEARGAGIGLHPMTTRYFDESSELDAAMVEIELPWLQFLDASGEQIYRERMNYIDVARMAFGRVALTGDAAFAVRPHAAAGTAKACADAWALRDALRDAGGDPVAALAGWNRASSRSDGSFWNAPAR